MDKNHSIIKPPPLTKGDTVAITATSMPCHPSRLDKGIQALSNMGLKVKVMESCRSTWGYLSGPDHMRLQDLHNAFADKSIKGIFVARGGYGAARLLPYLDYNLMRQNPKVFVGFSDITALHTTINQFCGLATYHGPMPASCLGTEGGHISEPLAQSISSLCGAVFDTSPTYQLPATTTIYPGQAQGILTGGNLAVIASLLGTPYEIETRGRILFLEEVQEAPYRVDRLLLQLKLAGKFKDASAIAFGDFSPETLETLNQAIQELIVPENKPTIWGLPCGHTEPNYTLPLGQVVGLIACKENPRLVV